jgi:hypothetical protein
MKDWQFLKMDCKQHLIICSPSVQDIWELKHVISTNYILYIIYQNMYLVLFSIELPVFVTVFPAFIIHVDVLTKLIISAPHHT